MQDKRVGIDKRYDLHNTLHFALSSMHLCLVRLPMNPDLIGIGCSIVSGYLMVF